MSGNKQAEWREDVRTLHPPVPRAPNRSPVGRTALGRRGTETGDGFGVSATALLAGRLCGVVEEGRRHPNTGRLGMQPLPPSPTGPTPLAAPPHAEAWRSRFVISAKANTPTLTLLGSGHEAPIHRLVEVTCAALASKTAPVLVDDGLGGTYFIKDSDGSCASQRFELGTRMAPHRPTFARGGALPGFGFGFGLATPQRYLLRLPRRLGLQAV